MQESCLQVKMAAIGLKQTKKSAIWTPCDLYLQSTNAKI